MIYEINKNILLVLGKKKSLIYDLRKEYAKIIWINEKNTQQFKKYTFDKIENSFIKELKKLNLLDLNFFSHIETNKNVINKSVNFNLFQSVLIELTNKCNFSCIHCYGNFNPNNFSELSIKNIDNIVKNLKIFTNLKNLRLLGGEPFVLEKNKLLKILKIIRDAFPTLKIEIYTNGYFLNDFWINVIKTMNIYIALSIYSDKENIHNKITQNSLSFQKLIKNIKKLEKHNIKYRISYIEMNINKNMNVTKIRKSFNLNINNFKSDILRISGKGNLKLLDQELLRKKSITLEVFKHLKLKSQEVKNRLYYHNCFSNKLYIDADLNVFPCPMERRILYGNLKKNSLKQLLEKNYDILTLTKDKIKVCSDCEFRYACFDCRPDTIKQDFYSKPFYCTYNPLKGEWHGDFK